MIILHLLHPSKLTAIQTWQFTPNFRPESVIRIGRSADNDVILSSPVVSRYHAEICYESNGWQLVNVSTNGTYIDQELTDTEVLWDRAILQLAANGPKIEVRIDPDNSTAVDM